MKTLSRNFSRLALSLTASLLVTGAGSTLAQNSPEGPWDCIMGGAREGTAYLTFNPDGTLVCTEVLVPKKKNKETEIGRYASEPDRNGTVGATNNTPGTHIFGTSQVTGRWGYDNAGQVIGFFAEDTDSVTNGISFKGKTVPGQRLSLVCSTPTGKITYKGVPYAPLPDISGNWYGTKKDKGQKFVEFFTLSPSITLPTVENAYHIAGEGPGYSYDGFLLLSAHNRVGVGFAVGEDEARAVFGTFKPSKASAKTHGWEQPDGLMTNWVTFDFVRQSSGL